MLYVMYEKCKARWATTAMTSIKKARPSFMLARDILVIHTLFIRKKLLWSAYHEKNTEAVWNSEWSENRSYFATFPLCRGMQLFWGGVIDHTDQNQSSSQAFVCEIALFSCTIGVTVKSTIAFLWTLRWGMQTAKKDPCV